MKKTLVISSIFTCIYGQIALGNTYNSIISNEHNKYEVVEKVEASSHSCQDILDYNQSVGDGFYDIYLDNETTFEVYCDMTTDGGGWTRLDNSVFSTPEVFDFVSTSFLGHQYLWYDNYLLVGDETAALGHDTRLDITLPFSYSQFYLQDYKARAKNGQIETGDTVAIYDWTVQAPQYPANSGWGDIAFGSVDTTRPTTSYTEEGVHSQITNNNITFPNSNIFSLGISSEIFSIRTTESGGENEDLYIWHSGYVFVR